MSRSFSAFNQWRRHSAVEIAKKRLANFKIIAHGKNHVTKISSIKKYSLV